MSENIFADEWHQCLEAHYMHVVRNNDRVTQPSLTLVMRQAGFSDAELAELRVRATMHIDDVSEDFVPDLEVLNTVSETTPAEAVVIAVAASAPETTPVEPLVDTPPAADIPEMPEAVVELTPDDDTLAEDDMDERELEDKPVEDVLEEPEEDPDAPQQLSLF